MSAAEASPAKAPPAAKRAAATGEAAQAPPAKKASPASGGPIASAASGAPSNNAPVPPLNLAELLETESSRQPLLLSKWVRDVKRYVDRALLAFLKERPSEVSFPLPEKCSLIPPLSINQAASGASLSAFREGMNYDHMVASFNRTRQYEAAGTVWMLDPANAEYDAVFPSQLEGCQALWSEAAYTRAGTTPNYRSMSFDVPLHAHVRDIKVAQRAEAGRTSVLLTEPLPMIAGRALVITWYSAMREALQQPNNDERVMYLFNAALSVPIRMRVLADGDAIQLAALSFAESMYANHAASGASSFWRMADKTCRLKAVKESISKQESVAQLQRVLKELGIAFQGKPLLQAGCTALKSAQPFLVDDACRAAFAQAEVYYPELRELTLLEKICSACSKRGVTDAKARLYFVFVMDCLRVSRLTGDFPKSEKFTVSVVVGVDRKTPAMIQALFKKKELAEYVFHEATLMDKDMPDHVGVFETPLKIVQRFATTGAEGLVASHLRSDSDAPNGMDMLFALAVGRYRDAPERGLKRQAMIDIVWPLWVGTHDGEVQELTHQEMQQTTTEEGFLWHKYLNETSEELGVKYRALVAACTGGPISAGDDTDPNLGMVGVSEYGAEEKEELAKLQEQLKVLRRKGVQFTVIPSVGGASGPEYSLAQLQALWGDLAFGHSFSKKDGDVRAFVLSAELFPPNVTQQGAKARLSEPMASDTVRFKRVVEFLASKRHKDDVVILFDGRGKANRQVIEECEKKLSQDGAHEWVEIWCVYAKPSKKQDPRAAARSAAYTENNREMLFISLPAGETKKKKVGHRGGFNVCGESTTADTTYTGIAMRSLAELPRMDHDTKSGILGPNTCASVRVGRLQTDVENNGRPFSYAEVKPISFWQEVMGIVGVTHIVDMSPGSGALGIAAAGAMLYVGVAASEAHRNWLDVTVDQCVMYKAGHVEGFAEQLGGDKEFIKKASKFFGGTMMAARRLMMPDQQEDDDAGDQGDAGAGDGDYASSQEDDDHAELA